MGTANEVLKKFKNGEVKYLDMRFTDPRQTSTFNDGRYCSRR